MPVAINQRPCVAREAIYLTVAWKHFRQQARQRGPLTGRQRLEYLVLYRREDGALLGPVLAEAGRSFEQWVVLAVIADGTAVDRDRLVARVVDARKFAAADVETAIVQLAADGALSAGSGQVRLTATGQDVRRRIRARIDEVTRGLFDFPADDLGTAGRVLATVTERANAFLASHTAR